MSAATRLSDWLAPLDTCSLECDGMARCIATLLTRERIAHRIVIGELEVIGVGSIPLHFWIRLDAPGLAGHLIDFRARMWLGTDSHVPHGVFIPEPGLSYTAGGEVSGNLSPVLFRVLTGLSLEAFGPVMLGSSDEQDA